MNLDHDTITAEPATSPPDYRGIISRVVGEVKGIREGNRIDHAFCIRVRDAVLILHDTQLNPEELISWLRTLGFRSSPRNPSEWKVIGQTFLQRCELDLPASWALFTGLLIQTTRPNSDMSVGKLKALLENRKKAVPLTLKVYPQQWTKLDRSQSEVNVWAGLAISISS
jgi:hypothetical protein